MSRLSSTLPANDEILGDQNLGRLMLSLRQAGGNGVTIAELLAEGVAAPAQAVYDLQLAGYDIDRVHLSSPGGPRKVSYRLRVTESLSD